MAQEEYRIEIDVVVDDNTDPAVTRAEQRLSRFERSAARTGRQLNRLSGTSRQAKGHMDYLSSSIDKTGRASEKTERRFFSLGTAAMLLGQGARSASAGLWGLANAAGNLHNRLWDAWKTAARTALVMGTLSAAAVATYGAVSGLRLAGEMDRARKSIDFFTGSTEKGQKVFEELVNYAIKSPLYEVPFVVKTGGQLLATGKSADFAMRSLKAFERTAYYTGASMAQIELAFYGFKQIAAAGSLQMEELRQVTENLNLPISWVAKELGLTGKELKNVGKEGIAADKAMDAILRTMEKRFPAGEMKDDLLAMASATKETGRMFNWAFGKGMSGGVMRIMKDLNTELDPAGKKFKGFAATLEEAGKVIGDKLDSMYTKIKRFKGRLNEHWDQMEELRRTLEAISGTKIEKLDFGDKLIIGLDMALDDVGQWLDGPGGKKVEEVFVKMAEIAGRAWMTALGATLKGAGGAAKEGNWGGAAALGAIGWMLGGGALLKWGGKGIAGAGKGVIGAGRWGAEKIKAWNHARILSKIAALEKTSPLAAEVLRGTYGISKGPAEVLRGTYGLKSVSNPAAMAPKISAAADAVAILGPNGQILSQIARTGGSAAPAATKAMQPLSKLGGLLKSGGGKALGILGKAAIPLGLGLTALNIATAEPGVERAKAIGGAAGGWGGAAAGAAAGAALGSVVPIVGNIAGGIIGGILGGLGGSMGGEWVGKKLSNPAAPIAAATKGPVTVQVTIQSSPQYKISTAVSAMDVMNIIYSNQKQIADQLADEMGQALEDTFNNMPVISVG